ncbi:MAG TPA: hypothetical protein VK835_08415 [Bacteroidia bacterium]|jgi:hypothetical protein|nr:hypothetical protein [Bacteroidia bacterium]
MTKCLLFICFIFYGCFGFAQVPDTLTADTAASLSAADFAKIIHKDTMCYRGRTMWFVLTPIFVTNNQYSLNCKDFKRAGIFGQKIRPLMNNIPLAQKDLNTHRNIKILGLIQMLIIAPLFLKLQIDWQANYNQMYKPPYPQVSDPGYIFWGMGILTTGSITYHFISRPFLKRAIKKRNEYYSALLRE